MDKKDSFGMDPFRNAQGLLKGIERFPGDMGLWIGEFMLETRFKYAGLYDQKIRILQRSSRLGKGLDITRGINHLFPPLIKYVNI